MTSRAIVLVLSLLAASPAWADRTGADVLLDAGERYLSADFEGALRLAAQAAVMPGPQRMAARFLYADALVRTGQYRRAKDVYVALWRMTSGRDRAVAEKHVIAANRQLKLSPTDGLPSR